MASTVAASQALQLALRRQLLTPSELVAAQRALTAKSNHARLFATQTPSNGAGKPGAGTSGASAGEGSRTGQADSKRAAGSKDRGTNARFGGMFNLSSAAHIASNAGGSSARSAASYQGAGSGSPSARTEQRPTPQQIRAADAERYAALRAGLAPPAASKPSQPSSTPATGAPSSAHGSAPAAAAGAGWGAPGSSTPLAMPLTEIDKRMSAIVRGVLAGRVHKERLMEVITTLWDAYRKGPYAGRSVSSIHDHYLIALVEHSVSYSPTAIAHYESHPEVEWSKEGLQAALKAAHFLHRVDMHAEVLVRLEELGDPITNDRLSELLESCIKKQEGPDLGRIYALLPRLANSGHPLKSTVYKRMVEAALADNDSFNLNVGSFQYVRAPGQLSNIHPLNPTAVFDYDVATSMPERAALSLRELVRARRFEYNLRHGMMRISESAKFSAHGGGAETGGRGSGSPAVDSSNSSSISTNSNSSSSSKAVLTDSDHAFNAALTDAREKALKVLTVSIQSGDVEAATVAYHACRDLRVKAVEDYLSQMERLRSAARIGAPALAEAILVDMLYGEPLLGREAVAAIEGSLPKRLTIPEDGADGHDGNTSSASSGGGQQHQQDRHKAAQLRKRKEMRSARGLSSALNLTAQAHARAGDVVGAARYLGILQELRQRWLQSLVTTAAEGGLGEDASRVFEELSMTPAELSNAVVGIYEGEWVESCTSQQEYTSKVAAAREAVECLAAIHDSTCIEPYSLDAIEEDTPGAPISVLLRERHRPDVNKSKKWGVGNKIGISGETFTLVSQGLLGSVVRMHMWSKVLEARQAEAKKSAEAAAAAAASAADDAAATGPGSAGAARGLWYAGVSGRVDEAAIADEAAGGPAAAAAEVQGGLEHYQTSETVDAGSDTVDMDGVDPELLEGQASAAVAQSADQMLTLGEGGHGSAVKQPRRPYNTLPNLASYGLAATLVGLPPESAAPEGHPLPDVPLLPAGSPGWPYDTEPLRTGQLETLAALASGYGTHSFAARQMCLGMAESWGMLKGRLPWAVEEGGSGAVAARQLFNQGPVQGDHPLGMGINSPWARSLLAAVTQANARVFESTQSLRHDGTDLDTSSTGSSGVPSGMAAARVDVHSLSLTSQMAQVHGGATAALSTGNFNLFETIKGSLGLPVGSRGPMPPELTRERPSLPAPVLAVLLRAMASSSLRVLAPALMKFATDVLNVQPDADCYAAMLAAHSHWRASALDARVASDIVRSLRDRGLSPNGSFYGELAYLLVRLGREEQAVATLEAAVRAADTLRHRVTLARRKRPASAADADSSEAYAGHGNSAAGFEGRPGHHDQRPGHGQDDPHEQAEAQHAESQMAELARLRGVTGVFPTPLPPVEHFERVVRLLVRRVPARDQAQADRTKPDWWDDVPQEQQPMPWARTQLGKDGVVPGYHKTSRLPLWRMAAEAQRNASYAYSPRLMRAIVDHLGPNKGVDGERLARSLMARANLHKTASSETGADPSTAGVGAPGGGAASGSTGSEATMRMQ